MKYFMLDIETNGTNPETDDILQIGILEVNDVGDYYEPGKSYQRTLHTSQPAKQWTKDNLKELYAVCRKTPPIETSKVRAEIKKFFNDCGHAGPVELMGVNLMSLDIPFVTAKGFLTGADTDANNRQIGDIHYRVFELKGVYNAAIKLLGITAREFYKQVPTAYPEIELPPGQKHNALYDCFNQLKTLNGALRLLRQRNGYANSRLSVPAL